eukprot:1195171-Alexandrium_andersonii.AAC.1
MPFQVLFDPFRRYPAIFCVSQHFQFAKQRLKVPGAAPWLAGWLAGWLAKGILVVWCWWSGAAPVQLRQ